MAFPVQQSNWEALAELDPMWAVLSEPGKRGGRWDRDEFYATGRAEATEVMVKLTRLGLPLYSGKALDLGCGPGRVTHGLAEWFDKIIGYDISEKMLELAREDAAPNESFVRNESNDLSSFVTKTFDFIYCSRVLQHIDADAVGAYLEDCIRLLRPGGTFFLQMLSHPTGWEGTSESSPDPDWEVEGELPHYDVCWVPMNRLLEGFLAQDLIVHDVSLVDGGREQSLFSYDYVLQKRT